MKTLQELESILINEISKISDLKIERCDYYNHLFADSSIVLCSILEEYLLEREDWEEEKWLDDSLLTKLEVNQREVKIWGVMIWGRVDVSQQWTDPFFFNLRFRGNEKVNFEYTYLFGESDSPEVTYEEFNSRRGIWDKEHYSSDEWNPSERDWKYIINQNRGLT